MSAKVINTEKEYNNALAELEQLMATEPRPGTPEADRLNLLAVLIENYEKNQYSFNLPDPIDAILFRMEQQKLLQRDLVPYMGSKSKISEVLARKRPLTIQMIRALHAGLGIPAEVLLQKPKKIEHDYCQNVHLNLTKFPVQEMLNRGWINDRGLDVRKHAEELVREFLAPLGSQFPTGALCRRTRADEDVYSMVAWIARVMIRASRECCTAEYKKGAVTKDFIREVIRLSWSKTGPLLAKEFLSRNGIALIIEPQLPKLTLDGAAILGNKGPVIGLTLRYDRLDSFWFTLIHELVHCAKHLKDYGDIYVDDLEVKYIDPREKETDSLTGDILIPRRIWRVSQANILKTPSAITELARDLNIHPAIIAGRIRRENNNYSMLNELVGNKHVRQLFPEIKWTSKNV